ncbi:MAG: type II toxin-antitoxin system PemK/MazF family toxin [Meiothermus ruber]|uniref:mRNA interferase n=1 Tax=Meiothermus ruber TaxID=277 RepID=A0A7C3DMV3_MEIRU
MLLRRGDIVLVNFDPALSGEAAATRPAVVVTNNLANDLSPAVVVVPTTTNTERIYPHEMLLPNNRTGLNYDSKLQPQFIRGLSKKRIVKVIGYVPEDLMKEVDRRIREYLAL